MSLKLYNPKANAPSIFIPAWLSQVSIKLLSLGAKMLYGRLSQWSSSNGIAFRSVAQLSLELGCKERTIAKYIKELKDNLLIGTYHPHPGSVNYYEFYEHEWMFAPIVDELCYSSGLCITPDIPPHNRASPPAHPCSTPLHTRAYINKKEIKEIKKTKQRETVSVFSSEEEVQNHLEKTIAKRKQFVEDEMVEQILFYIGKIDDFMTVNKKINIALKLIREGKWNVPQGFKGISSKSIRKREEEEAKERRLQHIRDGEVFRNLVEEVSTPKRFSVKEIIYGVKPHANA